MRIHPVLPASLAALLLLAACSDSNAPGGASGTISLRVATTPSANVSAAAAISPSLVATPLTFTDGSGNVLVIELAQVVLKQVSFERADNAAACPDGEHDPEHDATHHRQQGSDRHGANRPGMTSGAAFDAADQDEADDHDSCDARALGPILVDLPLNSGPQQQFAIDIEPGTYTAVRFHIHKANSGSEAPFLTEHPEFVGTSIRVTGTFNHEPFTYTTSLNAVQHQRFESPVTVDASGTTDVTLLVDLSTWFLGPQGALIDPATAMPGGANEHLVWDNIRRSFQAFNDHDHNGHPD
jgi:hypothetical protein